MSKRSRKGRISNNLVAASCAAVLTVYAAGYWRTRDAARQFETQAKGRRAAIRTHRVAATNPAPDMIEPSSPALQPRVEARAAIAATAATSATAQVQSPSVPARRAKHAPASTTAPQSTPSPASTTAAIVVTPIPMPPEPAPASAPESGTPTAPAIPAAHWRDGTYSSYGSSPHGGVDVRVVIKAGRILEVTIEACDTRYRCELLDPMLEQTVRLQNSKADYVSRATDSSDAFNEGLVGALNAALDEPSGKDAASQ